MHQTFKNLRQKAPLAHSLKALGLLACVSLFACGEDDKIGAGGSSTGSSALTSAGATSQGSADSTTGTPSTGAQTTATTGGQPSTGTGSTSTDTTGTAPLPAADLRGLVQAACGWGERCCDAQEFRYIYGSDPASCTEQVMNTLGSGPNPAAARELGYAGSFLLGLVTRVDQDRTHLDATKASACLAHLKAQACLAPVEAEAACTPAAATQDPCDLDAIFVGTVPTDGRCSSEGLDLECQPGHSCQAKPELGAGLFCVKRQPEGGVCSPSAADLVGNCDKGLFCSPESGTCKSFPKLGQACTFTNEASPLVGTETIPCAAGLSCSASTKTCVAACAAQTRCGVAAGETETAIPGADTLLCGKELSCVPTALAPVEGSDAVHHTFSCGAPRAEKGLCDSDKDCAGDAFCAIDAGQATGTCTPAIAAQATGCQGQDSRCAPGNFCKSNTCLPKIKADSDERCSSHSECDDASIGCVGISQDSQRCISKKLPAAADCRDDFGTEILPSPEFEGLVTKTGEIVLGASDFRYWANHCESRVCDSGKCVQGAPQGQACDLANDDDSIASCAFGLQCRDGQCQPMLSGGSVCEPKSDVNVAACHFDLMGGPGNENACTQIGGEFRCGLRVRDQAGSYCDGK